VDADTQQVTELLSEFAKRTALRRAYPVPIQGLFAPLTA
jgi:hypothetical protein